MGMNESWILIQGDHRDRFPDLFLKFEGYRPTGRVFKAKSRAEAESFVGYEDRDADGTWEIVQKAVFLLGPWTVIDDPELILMDDLEGLERVAAFLSSPVLAIRSLERSEMYGFRYVQPGRIRSVVSWRGIVSEDGDPIAEESGGKTGQFDENDIRRLFAQFRIDYDSVNQVQEFLVYELDESGEMEPEETEETDIDPSRAEPPTDRALREQDFKSPEVKSPWWKFW